MTSLSTLTMLAILLSGALAILAISHPAPLYRRILMVTLFIALVPTSYLAFAELMGRSRPMGLAWWEKQAETATVVATQLEPSRAIHLWLMVDSSQEPRAYRLPWSQEVAEQLHKAMQEAERNGTRVQMRQPFERSYDLEEKKFYALPQPALPEKPHEPNGPLMVTPEGQAA